MILSKKRASEIGAEVFREYAGEALEKSRPKEVSNIYVDKYSENLYSPKCPRCSEGLFESDSADLGWIDGYRADWNYCPYCGQRITWPEILIEFIELANDWNEPVDYDYDDWFDFKERYYRDQRTEIEDA